MHRYFLLLITTFLLAAPAASVSAQDSGDLEKRIELATEMHEIRPAREQIDAAIEHVSSTLPIGRKEKFTLSIKEALDYEVLRRHSIESMAKVFTAEELEAMVEFYSRPEVKRISEKMEEYNRLIEPKIFEMLDKAVADVRTGQAR